MWNRLVLMSAGLTFTGSIQLYGDNVGMCSEETSELIKTGFYLRTFARREDTSSVKGYDSERIDVNRSIKGYGNSLTAPHEVCGSRDCIEPEKCDSKTVIHYCKPRGYYDIVLHVIREA